MDLSSMYNAMNYSPLMSGYYGALNSIGASGTQSNRSSSGGNSSIGYMGQIPGYTIPAQPNVNTLAALPYSLAQALAAAAGQSQAANAGAVGSAMGNYYNASANLQAAPYAAWGNTQTARMNNLGNMNIAQIQGGQKLAGLRDLLAMADSQMNASRTSQSQNQYNGIGTNYGAGVHF